MVFLFAPKVGAQGEAGAAPSSPSKPRPRLELARVLDEMSKVRVQLEAAQARVDAALVAAEAASASAKAAEVEEVVRLADEARSEATAMQAMLADRIDRLKSLVERGAKEAPASLLPENDALRSRILAAAMIADRAAAEKKLLEIEREIAGEKATPEALKDAHVTLVRYCIADNQREMASDLLKSSGANAKKAEVLLVKALKEYQSVLGSSDVEEDAIGTSVHAASLRRFVQIEASLCAWYFQWSKAEPSMRSHLDKLQAHTDAGNRAFERLERDFPNAMAKDGATTFVQQARRDVESMRGR